MQHVYRRIPPPKGDFNKVALQHGFSPISLLLDLVKYLFKMSCISAYSRVLNTRRGRNKRGGWQILAKIINGEGATNRKVGRNLQSKNTAIRNFTEIKSSNDFVKISTKRT